MNPMIEELDLYFQSPYPYLYLLSHEEAKVVSLVQAAAAPRRIPVEIWSLPDTSDQGVGASYSAIMSRLWDIADSRVIVLKDFHHVLSDVGIVRSLRDMVPRLIQNHSTIIFLSPVLVLPVELEKEFTVIDVALPTTDELRGVLNRVMVEMGLLFDEEFADSLTRAARGLSEDEAYRVFAKAFLKGGGPNLADIGMVVEEKKRILKRSELLEFWETSPTMADIGGHELLKKWLAEREEAFSSRAREFGLPAPKGLLMVGVQGCGKSLTAKCVSGLWKIPLARFDFADLFRMNTTPEENMRRVIKLSETMAPIVLWLDEIDKAFALEGEGQSLSRVFGTFITWMQEKQSPVFVVATANSIDHLPPELLRKGRFDEIFFVDLPNVHERSEILQIHLKKRNRNPADFTLEQLARQCEYFGGAEIEQCIINALHKAFHDKRDLLEEDIVPAIQETVPLYYTYENRIKALREWASERARHSSYDTSIIDLFDKKEE